MARSTLTERLAADLDGAFAGLVRAHQSGVYATALRLTHNTADAEDIAQDVFLRAYRALQDYPPERIRPLKVRPWLASITINLCRNRARRAARRPIAVPLVTDTPDEASTGPEDTAERDEEAGVWATRLAALPRNHAAAVVLRHVWGLPYQEMADALDLPAGTVKAHVHRGLAALRTQIEHERAKEVIS